MSKATKKTIRGLSSGTVIFPGKSQGTVHKVEEWSGIHFIRGRVADDLHTELSTS